MAYAASSRAAGTSFSARLAGLSQSFSEFMAKRRVYRNTLGELEALNDRELADLGLHRSSIIAVARLAAYGK